MPTVSAEPVSRRLFDERDDRRLAEVFAPCFALILHLREATDYGDPEALRQRIKDLIARGEREAQRHGIPQDDIEQVRFALVAFLDETILSSNWPYRDQWIARPLQLELYERYDAGEVFFTRLEKVLAEPKRYADVLEVYYLCMTLGFKGQYQLQDQARLRALIDEARRALEGVPGMTENVLAPRGKPRGQVASEVRRKIPTWALVAAAVVLGLVLYLGLYLYVGQASSDVVARVDAVEQTQDARRR